MMKAPSRISSGGLVSLLPLLCLLLLALLQEEVTADCSQCDPKNGGICDAAWRGQPGQFCGHWRDWGQTLPCCCPLDAECALTTTHCSCRRLTYVQRPRGGHHHSSFLSSAWIWFIVLLLGCCCCCCCWRICCVQETEEQIYQPVPHHQTYHSIDSTPPVGSTSYYQGYTGGQDSYPNYEHAVPVGYPVQPSAPPPPYKYSSAGGGGGGGGYTGGEVLGAGATGLATGALLGSMFANSRSRRDDEPVAEDTYFFEGDTNGGGDDASGAFVEEFDGDF